MTLLEGPQCLEGVLIGEAICLADTQGLGSLVSVLNVSHSLTYAYVL